MFRYFLSSREKTERLIARAKKNAEKVIQKNNGRSVSKNGHVSGVKDKKVSDRSKKAA